MFSGFLDFKFLFSFININVNINILVCKIFVIYII